MLNRLSKVVVSIAEAPVNLEFDTIDDVVRDIAAGNIVTDEAKRERFSPAFPAGLRPWN